MKKTLLIFALTLCINLYSQELSVKDSLWTKSGNIALLLNQTGYSDWVGGGTNNFSGTIKLDYEWEFENQGWNLPERDSKEWNRFNDELGEKMRGVGLVFEKYCKFTPDVGEGVHLLDE